MAKGFRTRYVLGIVGPLFIRRWLARLVKAHIVLG